MVTFNELQSKMQLKKNANQYVTYSSRSAEDILDKFKSLNSDWVLTLEDKLESVGDIVYFTSKAFCRKGDELYSSTHTQPMSEPPLNKQGKPTMSVPQWFGAVSSYARKYALQGLFAIGETDFDQMKKDDVMASEEWTESALKRAVALKEISSEKANELFKAGKVEMGK